MPLKASFSLQTGWLSRQAAFLVETNQHHTPNRLSSIVACVIRQHCISGCLSKAIAFFLPLNEMFAVYQDYMLSNACFTDVVGPRLCEKALAAFLIFTVYWKIGDKTDAYDVPNIGGLLFLWVTLPAYGACAYTPVSFSILWTKPPVFSGYVYCHERCHIQPTCWQTRLSLAP